MWQEAVVKISLLEEKSKSERICKTVRGEETKMKRHI